MSAGSPWKREGDALVSREWVLSPHDDVLPREYVIRIHDPEGLLVDNPPGAEPTADEIVALRGEVEALTARVEALEAALRSAAALFGGGS